MLVDVDPQFNATQCVMDGEKYVEHVKSDGFTIVDIFDSNTRVKTSLVDFSSKDRWKGQLYRKCVLKRVEIARNQLNNRFIRDLNDSVLKAEFSEKERMEKPMREIKTAATWKKIVLILVAVVFMIRIGYIVIRGEVDKEYFTSAEYDLSECTFLPAVNLTQSFSTEAEYLNSIELYFANISRYETIPVTLSIHRGNSLIYQTDISLTSDDDSTWKRVVVNAEMKKGEGYELTLSVSEDCAQTPVVPVITGSSASEIIASYADGSLMEGNIAVNYGYLQFPGRADRMVTVSLWVLLYLIIAFALIRAEAVAAVVNRFREVCITRYQPFSRYALSILGALLIVNCSQIEFQELTKIIFYGLSLVSVTEYQKKDEYVEQITDKVWKRTLMAMLYFYAAFALVGQRIFIHPHTVRLTAEGLFVYLCTVLWFIPVIKSILYYLHLAEKFFFRSSHEIKSKTFIMIVLALLLLPAAYNLFANNPGISSPDTIWCMLSAHSLRGTDDWHPTFYRLVLHAIQNVWDSTYAVILVQYFFWGYVMLEFILYLRRKGISDYVLILFTVFNGFNAANVLHLNTIWKDIPYTLSLVWVFVILAKLALDSETYQGRWYIYLELITALVGVFFYRKNGVVTFVVVAVVAAILLRKNKKVLVSLVLSVMAVAIIKGPVYTYLEVEDTGIRGIYHGLGQDVLGVYYAGGEVSESTLQMINMMTNYNTAEYSYTPTWSNQAYDVDVKPVDFIKNYIHTFLQNPVIMLRVVIDREDLLWDIYRGQDAVVGCVHHTDAATDLKYSGYGKWDDYYDQRIYRSLYTNMFAATQYTSRAQWLSAIEWRGGLLCLLGLSVMVWMVLAIEKGGILF